MKSAEFICEMLEIYGKAAERGEHFDVVFMDPLRAGSDEAFYHPLNLLQKGGICILQSGDAKTRYRIFEEEGISYGRYSAGRYVPIYGTLRNVCLLSKLRDTKHHINVK